MLNKTQSSVLGELNIDIKTKAELITELYTNLEQQLNITFNKSENSNVYLLVETIADSLVKAHGNYLRALNNVNSFFDSNKFDGYSSGTYLGLRQALLELNYLEDINLITSAAGELAIVLLAKEGTDLEEKKTEVAQKIHKYISLGILTNAIEGTASYMQSVNASTGQAITYYFNECKIIPVELEISYFIDYESTLQDYDIEAIIRATVSAIWGSKYNKIGKDFKFQDFSLNPQIKGIARVDVTLNIDKNLYKNIDFSVQDYEILQLTKLTLIAEAPK